jgi:hypothetical protein
MSAKSDLKKAFYSFISTSDFYTNIGEKVYYEEMKQSRNGIPTYPYAVWTVSSVTPTIDSSRRSELIEVTMNIYSDSDNTVELDGLESDYITLLDGQTDSLTLTTDNYSVIVVKRTLNIDLPKLEDIWSGVTTYSFQLEKNRS